MRSSIPISPPNPTRYGVETVVTTNRVALAGDAALIAGSPLFALEPILAVAAGAR